MFDLDALHAAVVAHGRVARVVVAASVGSAPREAGAAMLIWADGQQGTIGGGALEWEAAARARKLLATGGSAVDRLPLGPALGQCCGGAVTLVTEVFAAGTMPVQEAGLVARALDDRAMPLAVKRMIDRARGQGVLPGITLVQGWLVEPVARARRALWVWGAGHVGRALVGVMAPLPDVAITWADVASDRFPEKVPPGVTVLADSDLPARVAEAPREARHLVLTYSHALDLELCQRLLHHSVAEVGLIGSATKWARFRSRLAALGHAPSQIARIRCPIGDPSLGKHPQAIAIGVAAAFLRQAEAIPQEARA